MLQVNECTNVSGIVEMMILDQTVKGLVSLAPSVCPLPICQLSMALRTLLAQQV